VWTLPTGYSADYAIAKLAVSGDNLVATIQGGPTPSIGTYRTRLIKLLAGNYTTYDSHYSDNYSTLVEAAYIERSFVASWAAMGNFIGNKRLHYLDCQMAADPIQLYIGTQGGYEVGPYVSVESYDTPRIAVAGTSRQISIAGTMGSELYDVGNTDLGNSSVLHSLQIHYTPLGR
jgi:hypothetical protein